MELLDQIKTADSLSVATFCCNTFLKKISMTSKL